MYIDYYIDDYTNDILCEFDTTKLLDIFENEKDLTNVLFSALQKRRQSLMRRSLELS